MKLLFIFLSSLVITNNSGSQAKATGAIPQNIITAFSTQYPGAHASAWKAGKDNYEATFKLSGKKYCAFYSPGGYWVRTERALRPWRLPAIVKNALHTSEYAAWYIDDVKEVNMPGKHMYIVHVDNAPVLTIPDPYLFKDNYELCYTEKGELVKAEKLPD